MTGKSNDSLGSTTWAACGGCGCWKAVDAVTYRCSGCGSSGEVTGQPEPAAAEPIMQFFAYGHLPAHLAAVSQPFAELASLVVAELPRNAERSVALRKLLEAKDAAVRARLAK